MRDLEIEQHVADMGVAFGLMKWCKDAYELTEKGDQWLRHWLREQRKKLEADGLD